MTYPRPDKIKRGKRLNSLPYKKGGYHQAAATCTKKRMEPLFSTVLHHYTKRLHRTLCVDNVAGNPIFLKPATKARRQ